MATPKKPNVPADLIIKRTEFPKWWKDLAVTGIDIKTSGAQIIVPWLGGKPRYLISLFLTVDGQTDLYLRKGYEPITGPMSFGGPDEPRAIVLNFSDGPIPCGADSMSLYSDPKTPPVQVSGTATYYTDNTPP